MKFEDFFRCLCLSLDNECISFLVLRNYELLPSSFGNDIDLLVNPVNSTRVKDIIINIASEHEFMFMKERVRFNFQSLELSHKAQPNLVIKMDIFSGLTKGWISYMSVEDVLSKRIEIDCFYIPSIEFEIYCLIMKEMYMYGYVRTKYKEYFKRELSRVDLNILKSLLDLYLSRSSSDFVLNNLNNLYNVKFKPKPRLKFLFDFEGLALWFYFSFKEKLRMRGRY